jgi:glutamyl-tRNA synthetase
MRERQQSQGGASGYDRLCRNLPAEDVKRNLDQQNPFVVRLAMPLEGTAVLQDAVYGPVEFDYKLQDDPVLLKSNGWPTYHLAAMVDDHDTEITHIIRGEDWLPSAPKHLYLFEAMGWTPPIFAHCPLIVGTDKKKLSKRHGSTQFTEFIQQGYLPEALFNFLSLLGWSPGEANREIFSREEIVERFSLDGISNHPAVFDYDKLRWMNGEYIRSCSTERLIDLCVPYLAEAGHVQNPPAAEERAHLERVIPLVSERIKLLPEVVDRTEFFFVDPQTPEEKGRRKWLTGDGAMDILNQAIRWFGMARDELTPEAAELAVDNIATTLGIERGPVIHTLRIAATGRTAGPGLFDLLAVLGKSRILSRLETAKSWVVIEALR